jgi:hypothetical protein
MTIKDYCNKGSNTQQMRMQYNVHCTVTVRKFSYAILRLIYRGVTFFSFYGIAVQFGEHSRSVPELVCTAVIGMYVQSTVASCIFLSTVHALKVHLKLHRGGCNGQQLCALFSCAIFCAVWDVGTDVGAITSAAV